MLSESNTKSLLLELSQIKDAKFERMKEIWEVKKEEKQ